MAEKKKQKEQGAAQRHGLKSLRREQSEPANNVKRNIPEQTRRGSTIGSESENVGNRLKRPAETTKNRTGKSSAPMQNAQEDALQQDNFAVNRAQDDGVPVQQGRWVMDPGQVRACRSTGRCPWRRHRLTSPPMGLHEDIATTQTVTAA